MRTRGNIFSNIDWVIVILYFAMVLTGWVNIYAAVYNEEHHSIFDITQRYGKQLVWIAASVLIILLIFFTDTKVFSTFAYFFYAVMVLILISVLLFGKEVAGSRSWFQIGNLGIQPAEFAKFATALALAKYLSTFNISLSKRRAIIISVFIILIPAGLILLQNDTGSALVFLSFILVLYREGLSGTFLITGLSVAILFVLSLLFDQMYVVIFLSGFAIMALFFIRRSFKNIARVLGILVLASAIVLSVDYAFNNFLGPHQQKRISVLIGVDPDIRGAGYNVHQSKIAIGSGGFWGKGFLEGTQTKYDFVPEQDTDFIFCTMGEEFGFIGSLLVIGLFTGLFLRIIKLAERQKSSFARIYGYGVLSVLLFHFMVNIGMTIGLTPVIGIPLPFFSYGGSSLWAFTILLFIFIRLDAHRAQLL
ncbi:MAG: rod shape-determining protein RodA [Bacteroidales bacterium]